MQSAATPSRALLRYLRTQTDSQCLTTAGTQMRITHCGLKTNPSSSHISYRYLGTSAPRKSKTQSSYIDVLWPKHRDSNKSLPAPRHTPAQPSSQIQHSRNASTESHSSGFFRRLFRERQSFVKNLKASQEVPFDNGSYEDQSAQLFNLSRALSRNPSGADLKLRCTEFDANGSVTLVSGEFKKSELIAKYGLLPRDLRKIDSSILPHILVRPTAILINLLHLRVLIQSDRVLVFDAYGSTDSYTQSLFIYDLEGKLRQKADPRNGSTHLPYEFRALEAVMISVTSGLEAEFALVRDPVTHILQALEEDIDREKLRHLLIHSKKLGTFEQKARLVRDAIDDLLEADDDLAAMYLTERKNTSKPRSEDDHQEVEMLLESYHKICDEIVEISGNLISNIRNTEEVVKAILDANRNQLMLLEIKFSIATLGLAGGTLFAGLYGMNLKNFLEESDVGFGAITAICFGLSAIICVYGMRKLHKVQKVRMWGEGFDGFRDRNTTGGRGNWKNEAIESHAQRQRKSKSSITGPMNSSASSGPVLWPGMEGLGMHKLNSTHTSDINHLHPSTESESDRRSGTLDTNSDADSMSDSPSSDVPATSQPQTAIIHDDLANPEMKSKEVVKLKEMKRKDYFARGKPR